MTGLRSIGRLIGAGVTLGFPFFVAGCAKHADFVELRDHLLTVSKSQDQDHQRMDAVLRRLDTLERTRDTETGKGRYDEISARLQKLEARVAKLDETLSANAAVPKLEPPPSDSARLSRPPKPSGQTDGTAAVPNIPAITPTSAFNLSYNDYLNGKYDLAVAGFQRFVKDFPGTSLTPNAYYWLGESYYQQKDYARAIQSFEYVSTEYPGNEKVPAALYKLGLAAAETGDIVKSKKSLKRVVEDFPASDEAKLAKNKLADIR